MPRQTARPFPVHRAPNASTVNYKRFREMR